MVDKKTYSVSDRHLQIDPWVGQTLKAYRKRKGWTQEQLGQEMDICLNARVGQSEPGLSKSAISRIEKGLFIPPQHKLELMMTLLGVHSVTEKQRLIELSGYIWVGDVPVKQDPASAIVHELNFYGLEALSYFNQIRDFENAQRVFVSAFSQSQKLKSPLKKLVKALIQAKFEMTHALERGIQIEARAYLEKSLAYAQEADRYWSIDLEDAVPLRAEILRSRLSALFRTLALEDTLALVSPTLIQFYYQEAYACLIALERTLLMEWTNSLAHLQMSLYVERERVSLNHKWLDIQERQALALYFQKKFPHFHSAVPPVVKVFAAKEPALLSQLYVFEQGHLCLTLTHAFQADWQDFYSGLQRFLTHHQALAQYAITPDHFPQGSILNTSLLYVLVLARMGKFSASEGELFLKSLFFLTDSKTLINWYYVSACFYAYRWISLQQEEDYFSLVQHWMMWCNGSLENPERYERSRFREALQVPCLWICFSRPPQSSHPLLEWITSKWLHLMQDEYLRYQAKGWLP